MATDRDDIVWLHAQRHVTLTELAEASGVPVASLEELVEYGALAPADAASGTFTAECVGTVRTAARLCTDLELELPALALVVRFLARIEGLEAEVRRLHAHLPK